MSGAFGDSLSMDNADSPIGAIAEKGQKWTDPLSWISGGKWADLTSGEIPKLMNQGLGYITRPAQKIDQKIDPLQQTGIGKTLGNFATSKPGDTIGLAIGSVFTGGALDGALGAGAGAGAGAGVGAAGAADAGLGAGAIGAGDAAGIGAGIGAADAGAAGAGAAGAAGGGFGGFGSLLGSDSLGGLASGAVEGGGAAAGSGGLGGLGGLGGTSFFGAAPELGDAGMGSGLFTGGGAGLDGTYGSTLDGLGPTGISSGLPGAEGASLGTPDWLSYVRQANQIANDLPKQSGQQSQQRFSAPPQPGRNTYHPGQGLSSFMPASDVTLPYSLSSGGTSSLLQQIMRTAQTDPALLRQG
jgi:hypothetical protein